MKINSTGINLNRVWHSTRDIKTNWKDPFTKVFSIFRIFFNPGLEQQCRPVMYSILVPFSTHIGLFDRIITRYCLGYYMNPQFTLYFSHIVFEIWLVFITRIPCYYCLIIGFARCKLDRFIILNCSGLFFRVRKIT